MAEVEILESQLDSLAKSMKPAHLKMAKALSEGKTQEEAYKLSGGKSKTPRNSATVIIQTNSNITEYVELFNKITSERAKETQIATKEEKRQMLWDAAQRCMQEVRPIGIDGAAYAFNVKGMVSCVSELNKMDGDLAAIKTETKNSSIESLIEELSQGDGED